MLLDVSELEVDKITLEVVGLRAHVSVLAQLTNLVTGVSGMMGTRMSPIAWLPQMAMLSALAVAAPATLRVEKAARAAPPSTSFLNMSVSL